MLRVGQLVSRRGNITTLGWIKPGYERDTEACIGFGIGRLAAGYHILLLKEPLKPDDFEFHGTTLRSGGRYGLPAQDVRADAMRRSVHDEVLQTYGAEHYRSMRRGALATSTLEGADRLAKIVPAIGHDPHASPARQYPPGGGARQWDLVNEKRFLVAVEVGADRVARTPHFSVDLDGEGYEGRRRLRLYMISA